MIGHPPLQYQQSLLTKPAKSVSPSTAAREFSTDRSSIPAWTIPNHVSVNIEPRPALCSFTCDKPAYNNIRNIKGVNPSSHKKRCNPILHMWILLCYHMTGYFKRDTLGYLNRKWKRVSINSLPSSLSDTHGDSLLAPLRDLSLKPDMLESTALATVTVSDHFIINKLNHFTVDTDISL